MRHVLRNLLIFFYALTVELSIFQAALLFGYYAPVGFVLTASDMPYLPPLSLVFLAPAPEGPWSGWGVAFYDAQILGVPIKVPVFHYYTVGNGYCSEYIPNKRATLGSTPIETLMIQLSALLPPWEGYVRPCVKAPSVKAVFVVPAWTYIPIMLFALRYRLIRRLKVVW